MNKRASGQQTVGYGARLLLCAGLIAAAAACSGGGGGGGSTGAPPPAPLPPPPGGALGSAVLLEQSNGLVTGAPKVVANENGDAIVVWGQNDAQMRGRIWVSHWSGSGWSPPQAIDNVTNTQAAFMPDIALNANGVAVVVWWQFDSAKGDLGDIYAAIYTPGTGWAAPQAVDSADGWAFDPHVAINDAGTAVVVWTQDFADGGFPADQIYASRRVIGAGGVWSPRVLVDNSPVPMHASAAPRVALDANGNAAAIWQKYDSTSASTGPDRIFVNHYGTAWGSAKELRVMPGQTELGGDRLGIVMVAPNHALAAWEEDDGTTTRVYRSVYSSAAWSAAQEVGAGSAPFLAAAGGRAMLSFSADVLSGTNPEVRAIVHAYTPAGGWDAGTYVDDLGAISVPAMISLNASGRATAVWQQFAVPGDVNSARVPYANFYDGTAWGTPRALDFGTSNTTTGLFLSSAALDGGSNAYAVWFDGDAWINRFTWP